MNQYNKQRGFTLIELTLSMLFISMLIIAIAVVTAQVSRTYARGITIKAVNQVGRDVSDGIKRDLASAAGNKVKFIASNAAGAERLGRLCTGQVSYVWNMAAHLGTTNSVKYSGTSSEVMMARVDDVGGSMCTMSGAKYPTGVARANSTEMLASDSQDLAVHGFNVDTSVPANAETGQRIVNVNFTIGSHQSGTIDTASQSCVPPQDAGSNIDYCAINVFDITARTNRSN